MATTATTPVQKVKNVVGLSVKPTAALGSMASGRVSFDLSCPDLRPGDIVVGADLVYGTGVAPDANIQAIQAAPKSVADTTGTVGVVTVQFLNSNAGAQALAVDPPTDIIVWVARN